MKIALIRLDKIGDLVSTLPVDQIPELQGHEVRWIVAKGVGFIPARAEPVRNFVEIPLDQPLLAQKELRDFLHLYQPEMAVIFYGPWWASKVLWQSKIPVRVGRRSQWHSFLFLNQGVRQSRSQSERHEAEYNLELLLAALTNAELAKNEMQSGRKAPVLELTAPSLPHLYEKFELSRGKYFVVHPGMAGSALNWPTKHYVSLIELLKQGKEVVVTGTASDEKWLAPLKAQYANDPKVQILQGQLNIDELLFVLKQSAGVVAPSTGILHLAASLGVPSVGLYSPVLAQHPTRWAARGPRTKILLATLDEKADLKSADLGSITPEEVFKCIKSL